MKNTIPVMLAASLFCFASCSKSNDTATTQPAQQQNTAMPVSPSAVTSSPSATSQQPSVSVGQSTPAVTQPAVTAGLNPPHGQPGHRCDIQVGAPLNSPARPAAPSSAAPASLPSAPVLQPSLPISTAKGLNPPHGQPGHDCSIAVGAPLRK